MRQLRQIAPALILAGLSSSVFAEGILETHTFEEHIQPLIQQYCYSCHGEGDKIKGDIDLTPYKTGDHVFSERDTWLYVLEQIETEEMPTKDPLPTDEERELMVEWIDARLNDIDWSQVREAGRVTIPRLNNTEYSNTLRDLLGVDTNAAATFSKDGEGQSGFTTDRDNLFITASDMEKYFQAAERALEATIALEAPPMVKRFESEKMFMTESDKVKTIKGLTGYEINRGQMTLYESMDFPYDGLYEFSIKGVPTVIDLGMLRLRIGDEISGEFTFVGDSPTTQNIRVYVSKGTHQISYNFEPQSMLPPQHRKKYKRAFKAGSTLVDWVQVRGPVRPEDAPQKSPVFFVRPSADLPADEAAFQIVERFAQRAFRRPVDRVDVLRYYSVYQSAIEQGETFTPSIKLALSAMLISPKFLFRHEFAPSNTVGEFALDDYQIASRLSYFLWMSMPDQELLDLAEQGLLSDSRVLRTQVRRMVRDPKSRSFTSAFLGQWLGYQSVGESVIPDAKIFPQFDEELAAAMKDETILTFEHLVKNNHDVLHLLNTKATFMNERLADHYKIEGIQGAQMRPVAIRDPNRGGLLGMASVLTATSSQTRTSPVLRGKWVLETLLGEHIPEPPADAGELSADAGKNNGKTLREELLIHRDNPDCRSCHERIDPIGFGLENFDAIGRFRVKANGKPIDSTGIVQGFEFSGIAQLKAWLIAERKDAFVDNISRRMLAFGLGRELETFDQAALLKIQDALATNDYGALTLIEEVVLSYPFLHQNNEQPELADL